MLLSGKVLVLYAIKQRKAGRLAILGCFISSDNVRRASGLISIELCSKADNLRRSVIRAVGDTMYRGMFVHSFYGADSHQGDACNGFVARLHL